jgi:cellulose synthase/poly-beta-1,6-N-acetylglucosamine synthase-like glycosyltransferase
MANRSSLESLHCNRLELPRMLALFFICLVIVGYVYFGYPLLLLAGAFGGAETLTTGCTYPRISIIVPAHDEELNIAAKLANLLESDYPADRVEILAGNDGSSDATEDIVRQFTHCGVRLISFPQQCGKSAIQNALASAATADILVFTDADCFCTPNSLRLAVEHFADERVGLVTASPRYLDERSTAIVKNESIYLRYETWLRRLESDRGLLAMASGSFFAMRRTLWEPLQADSGDDFVLPLRAAQAGMLTRLDKRLSVITHLSQSTPSSMLKMKIRIIQKDFRGLLSHRTLLNPMRYGRLAIALWSHKLLRWLVPYFLIAFLVANLCLLSRPEFDVFFILQAGFYALALVRLLLQRPANRSLCSAPLSFCLVNCAALLATLACLGGRASGSWAPHRARSSHQPYSWAKLFGVPK